MKPENVNNKEMYYNFHQQVKSERSHEIMQTDIFF